MSEEISAKMIAIEAFKKKHDEVVVAKNKLNTSHNDFRTVMTMYRERLDALELECEEARKTMMKFILGSDEVQSYD